MTPRYRRMKDLNNDLWIFMKCSEIVEPVSGESSATTKMYQTL